MTWFVKSTHAKLGRSIMYLGVFCISANDLNPFIEKSMYFWLLCRAFSILSTSLAAAFNAASIFTDQPLSVEDLFCTSNFLLAHCLGALRFRHQYSVWIDLYYQRIGLGSVPEVYPN